MEDLLPVASYPFPVASLRLKQQGKNCAESALK